MVDGRGDAARTPCGELAISGGTAPPKWLVFTYAPILAIRASDTSKFA